MNEKKICFIMCTNNAQYEAEAMHFISKLHVPQGYEIDAISIKEAKSLTSGYNEGMRASDAKYKVYLHQDVMIVEPDFIARLLHIFEDPEIGMVGMVGTPHLPENKIPWWAWRVGALYTCNVSAMGMFDYEYPEEAKNGVIEVEAIDGLLMATQYDIPWRDDLFDKWDFYDVSQSLEFIRHGYKVVDTGSTDDSRKIASAITPCVYEFAWCDDFSAARNYAVQKAGNDWILFLDSDEFVDMFDIPKLLEQMQTMPASIGHIHIKSLYESDGQMMSSTEPIARLFSRKLYHFEGRIHEQIVPLDTSTEPDYFDAPIYVTHVGYQGNDTYRTEKANRNLKLLLRELDAQPDDPYTLYQIGNSYFYSKQYAQAIPHNNS
jgi:hypothetical protein